LEDCDCTIGTKIEKTTTVQKTDNGVGKAVVTNCFSDIFINSETTNYQFGIGTYQFGINSEIFPKLSIESLIDDVCQLGNIQKFLETVNHRSVKYRINDL